MGKENNPNKRPKSVYTTALLATFVSQLSFLNQAINQIYSTFQLEHDEVYLFSDLTNQEKRIVTYNILIPENVKVNSQAIEHTIRMNRKKDSNTLYTINSLNWIIEKEIGHIDPKYRINWKHYKDTLLLYDKKNGLTKTPISLLSVILKEEFFKNGCSLEKQKEEETNEWNEQQPQTSEFKSVFSQPWTPGPKVGFNGNPNRI